MAVSIPPHQRPVRHRGIRVELGCTQACAAYALVFVSIGSGGGFSARSNTVRLRRRGTRNVGVPFSTAQLRALAGALHHHMTGEAEAFAVGVGPHGSAADVSSGVITAIRA